MLPKRKIIRINEVKCNGCGACVIACAEAALQLVNGKARLVKEQFCDGLGECLGECPTGALTIEERAAAAGDEKAVLNHARQTGRPAAVRRRPAAGYDHTTIPAAGPDPHPPGCPGMAMRFVEAGRASLAGATTHNPDQVVPSELTQWPVQLHLVQPGAPFFRGRELAVLSTCAPVASADIHRRFIRGRAVVVGCPKLDRTEGYAKKLGAILADPSIPKVTAVRMEVPCCGGLTAIVCEAVALSGRNDLVMEEITVGINGDIR